MRMKRTIAAGVVCLGLCPVGAHAVDWSASSTLSETVGANTNQFLSPTPIGTTFQSFSSLTANATARTAWSTFMFDGDISYRKYWEGLQAGTQSESITGGVKLHYEDRGKPIDQTQNSPIDKTYFDVVWRTQSTAFALLGELGLVSQARGFIDRATASGGIDRSITNSDFVSLTARSTYTSYDPGGGGTPFTDTDFSGQWRHRVSSVASLLALSEFEVLDFDDAFNSRLMMLKESGGIDATLSSVLSFHGTAGIALTQAEGAINGPTAQTTGPSNSGWTAGFITDLLLTYKMYQDTTIRLSATQNISPSLVGSLFERTTVGGSVTKQVNSRESLTFAADVNRQLASGSTTDYASVSAGYHYNLTREWSASLNYRFLHRFAIAGTPTSVIVGTPVVPTTGAADSHSVMATLSRHANILPDGN